MSRYLANQGWTHVFDGGERHVDWVFDLEKGELIHLDVHRAGGPVAGTAAEIADVTESVKDNMDLQGGPEGMASDLDCEILDEVPDWASPVGASPAP